MRILKTAALALALAAPGMAMAATDGTLGATSTGTFEASITLENSPASQVRVYGLDDTIFGTQLVSTAGQLVVGGIGSADWFCITRSDPGNVLLTVHQTNSTSSTFSLHSNTDGDGNGFTDSVPFGMTFGNLSSIPSQTLENNSAVIASASPNSCTNIASSSHHRIDRRVQQGTAPMIPGIYSQIFGVTVAPQ